ASVSWNYTTVLNLVFLCLAAALVWRFIRSGGLPMLRQMNRPAEGAPAHAHHWIARLHTALAGAFAQVTTGRRGWFSDRRIWPGSRRRQVALKRRGRVSRPPPDSPSWTG